jgi:hypothetical protein
MTDYPITADTWTSRCLLKDGGKVILRIGGAYLVLNCQNAVVEPFE